MNVKTARNIHLFLLAFLGLSAFGGGAALIISPSGKLLGGLPLSILQNSPFNNFLIPGIILFVVLGLFPSLLIFALLKKTASKFAVRFNFFKDMHWAWSFSIYVGFAIIIWLQTEMYFLQAVGWLHNFYMILAIAIIFVALLPEVRNLYKINFN
jgi:hypothetical protein